MGQPGPGADLDRLLAQEFEARTGIRVHAIEGSESATDRLFVSLQFLHAGADVDVYMVDVTWSGIIAPYALDLGPTLGEAAQEHFAAIVANNTVDGALVAMPYFVDAGLLYYRIDLLEKYGYDAPPQTWTELEEMAATIQAGERADNPYFWGFTWQGANYEGLTCNALEWQVSHGGGAIVKADGRVSVNNSQTIAAFERARGWIGTISSPGIFTFMEEDSRAEWQAGNAAFMRSWPYAYALGQAEGSPIRGQFDVALLPRGDGPQAQHAATLGGWQLMVSKNSHNKEAAMAYVRFLTSPEIQKRRALAMGNLPSIPRLYDDAELRQALPFLTHLEPLFSGGAVARPSTVAGSRYGEVSMAYFTAVHQILTGKQEAAEALSDLETELQALLE
jgi:trehalose/maltose transport system substrate-binding protein